MQRKSIEVGKEYGVLARVQNKRREEDAHGPAKVISLDAKYEKSIGSYSIRKQTMNDGIAVTFDHDVRAGYGGYRAAKPGEKGGTWDKIIPAGTPIVLDNPKLIVSEWAPIAEMRARHEAERRDDAIRVDRAGDANEPVVRAVKEALAERGIAEKVHYNDGGYDVRLDHRRGVERERVIGARFSFEVETLASLLGIAVKA